MSYLRGSNYIWSDSEDRVHFWIGDGHEDVSEMEWSNGLEKPGAVSIRQGVLDQYVVMRFAELLGLERERLTETIRSVVSTNSNHGASTLKEHSDSLEEFVKKFDADV